jgi:hypothetical protein
MKRPILSVVAALNLGMALAAGAAAEGDKSSPEKGNGPPCLPDVQVSAGAPQTFATHADLARYGFLWGPSDGNLGAIPSGGGNYTFFGAAGVPPCGPGKSCEGTFAFSGTLDHVTGAKTGKAVIGPGSGPAGWAFDKDYAGGGQVVRFDDHSGHAGWLMSFHGEYHWKNLASPPGYWCSVGNTKSQVPCFYSGIGLAVSLDRGQTFKIVGQIMQPVQPLSKFVGSGTNMPVGYGSLIVADAQGRHLDNPPPDPREAYFYLVFADQLPAGTPGVGACAGIICMGIARARYEEVIGAALSGDPGRVAKVFHKYDGAAGDVWAEGSWSQPATSAAPDLSGTAGSFAPLWSDAGANQGSVIYDRDFDVYLAVYNFGRTYLRASKDLIHWTPIIGVIAAPTTPAAVYYYPTLIGETGDPTVAGAVPRIYFTSFPANAFPNYKLSTFEYVELTLSGTKHAGAECTGDR